MNKRERKTQLFLLGLMLGSLTRCLPIIWVMAIFTGVFICALGYIYEGDQR